MKKIIIGIIIGVFAATSTTWATEAIQKLENENGEVRAETFIGKQDNGVIQLYDANGLRVQLAATSNKGSVLGLRNKEGNLRTWITAEEGVINGHRVITQKEIKQYYTKEEVDKKIQETVEELLEQLEIEKNLEKWRESQEAE
jgi:3-polyprenyl-4-hydroxybenzoate decarboxylase